MGIFIGIDQSYTSTGCCVLSNKLYLPTQMIDFAVYKTAAADGDMYHRAITVTNNIIELCRKYPNSEIAIEGLSFGQRGSATRDLAGLQYVIITSLRTQLGINNTVVIAPKSVKKLATGSGGSTKVKVTKNDMVDALPDYIKNDFTSKGFKKSSGLYDLTDAFWIAKSIFKPNVE